MKESANRLASGTVGRALLVPTVATFLLIASLSPASACVAKISDAGGNVAGVNISGTNVWVRMYVYNSEPNCNHHVKAYLGGSVLAELAIHVKVNPAAYAWPWHILRTDATGRWQSEGDEGYVKFDTTHKIMDGNHDYLRVWLEPSGATGFYSNQLDGTGDGNPDEFTLYNKAYVLAYDDGNPVRGDAADAVYDYCAAMKHSAVPGKGGARTYPDEDEVKSNLKTYTVFYICTHGRRTGAVTYFTAPDRNGELSSSEVDEYVRGNPPKGKRPWHPYYNIVHIDACHSAEINDMAKAFDMLTADGGKKGDRAYLGVSGLIYPDENRAPWVDKVWERLAAGEKIQDAVNKANELCDPFNGDGIPRVYGDRNSTLHSVYGGEVG